jgi:hypothetical protein
VRKFESFTSVASLCQPTDLKGNPRIGLGVHHGIIVKNNPIAFVDPWGLCAEGHDFSQLKPGADASSGPMAFYGAGTPLIITGAELVKYGVGMAAMGGPVGWIGGSIVGGLGASMWVGGVWTVYKGWQLGN